MGAALTYARRYALFTLVGLAGEDDLDAPDLGTVSKAEGELPRADYQTQLDGHGGLANRPPGDGGKSTASARPVLAPDKSATLRERLVAELSVISSADDAAVWAVRNLPVKNTLTAADAKIVEERFQTRVSAISEGHASDGTTSAETLDGLAPQGPAHAVPDKNFVSAGQVDADTARKLLRCPKSDLTAGRTALRSKPSGCAIRNTAGSCCGNLVLCAAACHRIRITSRLPNRVRWGAE